MAPRWGAGVWAIIMRPLVRRPVSERGKTEQMDQRVRRWPQRGKTAGLRQRGRCWPQRGKAAECANGAGIGRNAARWRGAPIGPALAATRPKEIAQGNALGTKPPNQPSPERAKRDPLPRLMFPHAPPYFLSQCRDSCPPMYFAAGRPRLPVLRGEGARGFGRRIAA